MDLRDIEMLKISFGKDADCVWRLTHMPTGLFVEETVPRTEIIRHARDRLLRRLGELYAAATPAPGDPEGG